MIPDERPLGMAEPKETVTIPAKRYEWLKRRANLLACLEAVGVDNWDGWSEALRMHDPVPESDDEN